MLSISNSKETNIKYEFKSLSSRDHLYTEMPSKNTLGVKKGEAKSEAPVNVKITSESTGD